MTTQPDFLRRLIQAQPYPIPEKVFIIAEIGINHNGCLEITKQLIDASKHAGADAVKFQKRSVDVVYTPEFLNSPRESPWGKTQREQKMALELQPQAYHEIDDYCKKIGIEWFASSWDIPSQDFLSNMGVQYNKIASPMITHRELVQHIAKERKLTFISTGMCELDDIDYVAEQFYRHQCPWVLLHCISDYPPKAENLNLSMIYKLRERYSCPVGYSGHEADIYPSIMAAMMGAVAIERHITLDRNMYGSDQKASLEPHEFAEMIRAIRMIPTWFGDGVKRITDGEQQNAKKLRYWEQSSAPNHELVV